MRRSYRSARSGICRTNGKDSSTNSAASALSPIYLSSKRQRRTGSSLELTVSKLMFRSGAPLTTFYFDLGVAKHILSPLRSGQGTIVTRAFPMQTDIPGEDRDLPIQVHR
jgi:hypothetical protein